VSSFSGVNQAVSVAQSDAKKQILGMWNRENVSFIVQDSLVAKLLFRVRVLPVRSAWGRGASPNRSATFVLQFKNHRARKFWLEEPAFYCPNGALFSALT
jgi:hypothetical protein